MAGLGSGMNNKVGLNGGNQVDYTFSVSYIHFVVHKVVQIPR